MSDCFSPAVQRNSISIFATRKIFQTMLTIHEIKFAADYIRSSEKFLSFYKEIMNAQHFPFYIILSNYVRSILFYQSKDYNVRQIRFHVRIKMHRCKRWLCKRKTLFGLPNKYRFHVRVVIGA